MWRLFDEVNPDTDISSSDSYELLVVGRPPKPEWRNRREASPVAMRVLANVTAEGAVLRFSGPRAVGGYAILNNISKRRLIAWSETPADLADFRV